MSEQSYISVQIDKRFTDSNNQLWSPGVYEIDPRTAEELIRAGHGTKVDVIEEPSDEQSREDPERILAAKSGYIKKADRVPTELFDSPDTNPVQ